MSCPVCCDDYNRSSRNRTECPYCPFQACASCAQRYLLDTTEDAHCMSCRRGWDRAVLVDNFTSKFVTQVYKERREDLLFDRERSLMPATQPYVEIEIEIRKINKDIAMATARREAAAERHRHVVTQTPAVHAVTHNLSSEFDAIINIHRLALEESKACNRYRLDIEFLNWKRDQYLHRMFGEGPASERRQFVRACPYNGCKGFLSTAWKCGLCDNWTCPECHEGRGPDKDAPHTCDAEHLATARLLARDSRNCPKCAALIFKIDGCDQMYCTQCHTAFSWRRGTIETGHIHNPHYYDYQRRLGNLPRNPGDVPCGGIPEWYLLARKLALKNSDPLLRLFSDAHRMEGHVRFALIPRYTTNIHNENRDLRIKYMIGDLTDNEFKKKIQQREKARLRKNDIRQVLEMIAAVLVDLFQSYNTSGDMGSLAHSLTELKIHVNETFMKISRRWSNCVVPKIHEPFLIHT